MKVLKFGAVWCAGCLVMKPRWQEIEQENPWLKTEYYDFDVDKEAVEKYKINKILPTFIFLDNQDNEFLRLSGEIDKKKIIEILEQNRTE
ncbi:MAG TPA: thioredoxin family protein [bacterium]|nr:thioredoxin family protein [bacterium]